MKSVIKLLLILLFALPSYAQQDQNQLKREQQKLEKRISNTKKLLNKVKNNTQASLNEILKGDLAVFFIYTEKELPVYADLHTSVGKVIQQLIKKVS